MTSTSYLLAGDIGGTKTVLALFPKHGFSDAPLVPLHQQIFQNSESGSFNHIIAAFLRQCDVHPTTACFGIAGPVLGDQVEMTNLNWRISAQQLQQCFNFNQVSLINDLAATAMGAIHLSASDVHVLNKGKPVPDGTIGVLAPGTGLGEAFLLLRDGELLPVSTEGGHAGFSPRNPLQIELLRFIQEKTSDVSMEQVCSGLGLPNLFSFMQTQIKTPDELASALDSADNPAPVIGRAALDALSRNDTGHIAVQTLYLFADILADEAANLALKTMALGGIFIGGGIPPKILPFFQQERFMSSFSRGVFADILTDIPIHIILNPQTALLGTAAYGQKRCH